MLLFGTNCGSAVVSLPRTRCSQKSHMLCLEVAIQSGVLTMQIFRKPQLHPRKLLPLDSYS